MSAWAGLGNFLALTFTGRIFDFVSLVVLGVAGCLLCHEQQILNSELQRCSLLGASHLGQECVDALLREVDYALA